jgi:hypothetical protein
MSYESLNEQVIFEIILFILEYSTSDLFLTDWPHSLPLPKLVSNRSSTFWPESTVNRW